jgi:hypothetical protein
MASSLLIALLFVFEVVTSNDQYVPWAQVTAAPLTTAQYVHRVGRRDYDTANPHLYGYTSVALSGARTQCGYTILSRSRNLLMQPREREVMRHHCPNNANRNIPGRGIWRLLGSEHNGSSRLRTDRQCRFHYSMFRSDSYWYFDDLGLVS